MSRYLRTTFFIFASCVLAAGLTIAGEAGPAAASTVTMSTANWLMALPIVLVLAAAFGVHFREKRLIIRHRVTITNPDQDHSTRRYHRNIGVPMSAILPLPASLSISALTATEDLSESRRKYRKFLRWTTNLFGSLRVFTYLPTILTLWASADSSQYSLLTWTAWVIANASLTASIYEQNGRKLDNLVLVNACNAMMCLVTVGVIFYLRHV
jgi:hypothetical protein